ncbi:hypothetical protein DL766_009852 [Monosporascus sp. MC13-8B]|uniref:Uncharacterized protein n=1 Tax=Monosporascus cannonballus TaxID=155416 RepID=A0ABY0HE44_9PEZI|nr:hypothetical protein DL762_002152 [Monosporascus cannonballus]RYP13457.1 hypothetical protein DL766_009852 [Monosporascus sp. MC13-8B]
MPSSDPHPPRSRAKPNLKSRSVRKCITIQCRSDKAYTCQLSLLILLNARSCCTLRLIDQSDSRRSIEVRRPRAARSIPFDDFLYRIGGRDPFPIQLGHLDTLEESLVTALRLLHAKRISFPVSAEQIELLQPLTSVPDSTTRPTLFLPYNKRATWASDDLPPTWQADQLSDARLIFRIAKLLLRLSDLPSGPALLDLPSQHALATHLSRNPPSYHIDLCLGVAPVTAELAYQIALALVLRNKGQESCDVLESFFGGPIPLPKPGTSPDTIYISFLQLRARVCHPGGRRGSAGLDQDFEDKLQLDSPATLARLVCCRAQAATLLKEHDEPQWWLTAMSLYDAFLSHTGPSSKLERICAFDLYRYRDE